MGIQQVNNLGTNYVLYYNIVNYWKTIMSNHPSIQRVTLGDNWGLDNEEFPQYPIGNILVTNARFADKIKLKNNLSGGPLNASETNTNEQKIPYYGTDDTVDIHANTLAIINDLLSYTQYSVQAFDITSEIRLMAFKDKFDNGLAGWVATFDLITHNERPRCLFNLYP